MHAAESGRVSAILPAGSVGTASDFTAKGYHKMRTIITHHTSSFARDHIEVLAVDEPGSGGAHHDYVINVYDSPAANSARALVQSVSLKYQHGPIKDGVNGILDEALLAVVADRLGAFSQGEFRSRETALAHTKVQEAILWMQERQRERASRGVQGELKA